MKEARLLLDVICSESGEKRLRNGRSFLWAGDLLCQSFGGYTSSPTLGCWFSDGALVLDASIEFRVAIHNADWPAFKTLALHLAEGQSTVYVVSPHGEVEILVVLPPSANEVVAEKPHVFRVDDVMGEQGGDGKEAA